MSVIVRTSHLSTAIGVEVYCNLDIIFIITVSLFNHISDMYAAYCYYSLCIMYRLPPH